MDLTRWGQQPFRRISDKTRSLYEYIGDLLDGERSLIEPSNNAATVAPFEARADVERIISMTLPSRGSVGPRLSEIFESLSLFYEAGFHLRRDANGWNVPALFLYGHLFEPNEPVAAPFIPPLIGPRQVARGRSSAVLGAFQLDTLTQLRDSQAFLFGVDGESLFLLLCDRPAPWLEDHVVGSRGALDAILDSAADAKRAASRTRVSTSRLRTMRESER